MIPGFLDDTGWNNPISLSGINEPSSSLWLVVGPIHGCFARIIVIIQCNVTLSVYSLQHKINWYVTNNTTYYHIEQEKKSDEINK